jgi:hypothetical protein
VKNIDISFSHDLDPDSVNSKNFRMDPFVDGKITLKNNNTISYELSSKLVIGTQYSITISKDVKSSYGTSIGKDVILNFEAIA